MTLGWPQHPVRHRQCRRLRQEPELPPENRHSRFPTITTAGVLHLGNRIRAGFDQGYAAAFLPKPNFKAKSDLVLA